MGTRAAAGVVAWGLLAACSVGSTGDGGGFASVSGGGGAPSSESSGDGGDAADEDDDDSEGDDGGDASSDDAPADASTDPSAGDSSDGGGATTSEDGESSGDAPPDVGPACGGAGAIAMPGAGGPAAANQYCPQTDFAVQVMGAPGPIADVDVSVDGVLANTSQNRLWLVGPSGTQVLLFDHRGTFLTDDFVGTLFDDEAASAVASAPGPFHGCYAPEQPLASFAGQPADGTWILRVETCLYETSIGAWQLHLDFG